MKKSEIMNAQGYNIIYNETRTIEVFIERFKALI